MWKIKPKAPGAFLKQYKEFSPLVAQLLYNRGIKKKEEIDQFFNPDYQKDLHNPFLLKGMEQAIQRILQAIKKKEKIVVYGDFDADGICSSAILFLTLKKVGVEDLDIYIPDRDKENHGLNQNSIQELFENKTKFIITVDCASTDLEEAELISSLGIDLIVTDHHQTGDKLPQTIALINPLQKKETYPFKNLAGAGVAYKLACALLSSKEIPLKQDQKQIFKKWLLDLVALATVADLMPLLGENRTLVKYGLGVLAQTQWIGLKELMNIAKVTPQVAHSLNGQAPQTNLDAFTLGFILGPRLNAASRIDHANKAFRLLITQDKEEAKKLAQEINQNNLTRQNLTEKITQEVEERLKKRESKMIFEGSPDWPVGLIGLVASRIKERYQSPVIIFQEKKDLITASARSIPEFDLVEAFKECSQYLDDFGGRNKTTGGFRVKKKYFQKVKKTLIQLAEEKLKDKDLTPVLEIEKELALEDITWSNFEEVQKFAPFGKDNPEPVFLSRGLEINDLRVVGNNGGHLKLDLIVFDQNSNKARNFKGIGFGLGEKIGGLKKGNLVDLVFKLSLNKWNGYKDLELKIIDLRLTNS